MPLHNIQYGIIEVVVMTNQFSAQDPALGYLYQIKYALWLLLEAGKEDQGIEIAIENLDDIDIIKDGNKLQLIQTKLHRNLDFLTNSSADLWKTIRIWCSNFKDKKFQIENTILTIVTTGIAPDGSIANMLRPIACGGRDVEVAVEKLIDIANRSTSQTNLPAYTIFKSLSKEEQILLVEKIQVLDASSTIIDLRQKIINILTYSARKEYVEAVYEHIVGRWNELVISHLYGKSSDYISHKLLSNMIDDIREQYYKESLPINFPQAMQIEEKDLDEDERIFIEQLKLVQIGEKRIKHAISDFYRSSRQRSLWIKDFLIPIFELETYDAKLYEEWDMIFATMEEDLETVANEEDMVKMGRKLYSEVMRLNIHIRHRCTEEFITRGSYHILANQLRLGWHVCFKDCLSHLLDC
jgi:hypothetical protein